MIRGASPEFQIVDTKIINLQDFGWKQCHFANVERKKHRPMNTSVCSRRILHGVAVFDRECLHGPTPLTSILLDFSVGVPLP